MAEKLEPPGVDIDVGDDDEDRFGFGSNWARYLELVDDDRIAAAEDSIKSMLGVGDLAGVSFLDIGSGSGLFSLAAARLGASVVSFDYDSDSVACTETLRDRYRPDGKDWAVTQGSVLDKDWLSTLGKFDVVYSWGVLHHTGAMWNAMEHACSMVADRGALFISIYNDQGLKSRIWRQVKRLYNRVPPRFRFAVVVPAALYLWIPALAYHTLKGRPWAFWRDDRSRGMSLYYDLIDWVGGYPFEVATVDEVFGFCHERGFVLDRLVSSIGGCNQFVFRKRGSVGG